MKGVCAGVSAPYSEQLWQHKLGFGALQFDGFKALVKPSCSGNTRRDVMG